MYLRKGNLEDMTDDNVECGIWAFQLIVWLITVIIAKTLLFGVQLLIQDELGIAGLFLLSPFLHHKKLELVVVMVIIPVCLNATQVRLPD